MAKRNSVNVILTATALSVLVAVPSAFASGFTYVGLGVSLGSHVVRHAARHYYNSRNDYYDPASTYQGVSNAAYVPSLPPAATMPPATEDADTRVHRFVDGGNDRYENSGLSLDHSTGEVTTTATEEPAAPVQTASALVPAVAPPAGLLPPWTPSEHSVAPSPMPAASEPDTSDFVEPRHRVPNLSDVTPANHREYQVICKAMDLFNRGVDRSNNEQYAQAVDLFQNALRIVPQMPEAHGALGMAYDRLKDYKQALPELMMGLEGREAQPELYFAAADSYAHLGQYHAALKCYSKYAPIGKSESCVDEARRAVSIINHDFLGTVQGDYLADATAEEGANHWPASMMPLKVYIDGSTAKGFKPEFATELRKSFESWQSISGGKVSFTFTNNSDEANIKCAWTDDVTKFGDTQELGLTHCCFNPDDHQIEKATIDLYSLADRDNVSDDQLIRTARSVQLHEIGHALGLGHSKCEYDIMYPLTSPEGLEFPLTTRDQNTIVALYGDGTAANIASANVSHRGHHKHSNDGE
ncbi:MAG TPA: matrixin family metalloprotease [Planktothrix sp.]